MPDTTNPHGVKPGQVWADNDPRSDGRELYVVDVVGATATVRGATGRTSRIRLDRFRPTSTGYRLVRDVQEA